MSAAAAEVGKRGSYADGGFWCAKYVSAMAERAQVPGWQSHDSPAWLHADAQRDGRLTARPEVGQLVFVDLYGPGGVGHGQITHIGIVEAIEGDVIHTIEGNLQGHDVVARNARTVGDGYAVAFGRVA